MKPITTAFSILLGCALSLPALAGSCSLGRDMFNNPTADLDGKTVAAYKTTDEAISAVAKLRRAGLCSSQSSLCGFGRDMFNNPSAIVNGKNVGSFANADEALDALVKLGRAGLCDQESNCSLGRDMFNNPAIIADGKQVSAYKNLSEALNALENMGDAGLCRSSNRRHFDHRDSRASGCEIRGSSVYINNGSLLETYRDSETARLVLAALEKAGTCSRR